MKQLKHQEIICQKLHCALLKTVKLLKMKYGCYLVCTCPTSSYWVFLFNPHFSQQEKLFCCQKTYLC